MTAEGPGKRRPNAFDLLDNRRLHLIVMPTEQCQLRCSYCYQEFEHQRMRRAVVAGLRRWIECRAPGLEHLHLEWFGGEPLLAADLVLELQGFAREAGARHGVTRVGGSMTTNGLLLGDGLLHATVGAGIREFQITLDGPREIHDRVRHTAGGTGTFDRIWENLSSAAASDLEFTINVRVHLTSENRSAVEALLHQCGEAYGGDRRFRIALRPLHSVGDERDATLPLLGPGEREGVLEDLFQLAETLGLAVLRLPFGGDRPRAVACYAAAGSSFVIRPNGDLAKCTMNLGHPNNRVGRLNEDGTLTLDSERVAGWMRGILSGVASELQCPARGLTDRPSQSVLAIVG